MHGGGARTHVQTKKNTRNPQFLPTKPPGCAKKTRGNKAKQRSEHMIPRLTCIAETSHILPAYLQVHVMRREEEGPGREGCLERKIQGQGWQQKS